MPHAIHQPRSTEGLRLILQISIYNCKYKCLLYYLTGYLGLHTFFYIACLLLFVEFKCDWTSKGDTKGDAS